MKKGDVFKPAGTHPGSTLIKTLGKINSAKAKIDKEDRAATSRARARSGRGHKYAGLIIGFAGLATLAITESATDQPTPGRPYTPISQNQPYSPENKNNHYDQQAILIREDYIPGIKKIKF